MGMAAVVSLERYQTGKWQEGLRAQMHQALDNWLDEIESEMKTPKPTLEEITKAVFQDREKLTKVITEGLIETRYKKEQELDNYSCPECGCELYTPSKTGGLMSVAASKAVLLHKIADKMTAAAHKEAPLASLW
jgi:hypothetical protein